MEADYRTETGPPLVIGGMPNNETRTTDYALRIPHGLSFLLTHRFDSKVDGLENFPRSDWPNVLIVHWSFDLMVGSGMALFMLSAAAGWLCWRHRRLPDGKWFLRALVVCGPLGFVAIEAGWVVTEVGRQPWIIYGVMRTAAAVTPLPGIAAPFATFMALYIFLGVVVAVLLRRLFLQTSNPQPSPSTP
jgi:cytochrome d ubiquinol oxidase subunit I